MILCNRQFYQKWYIDFNQLQSVCFSGPFAKCHDFVDPEPIFDTCSYDVCAVPEKEEALCDNLAVYARACQEAGGSPGQWWENVPQCGE